MNKLVLFSVNALSISLFSGCWFNKSKPINMPDYIDKQVNVYRKKNTVDKKMTLRYFSTLPNVPYANVSDYFKEFFNIDLNCRVNKGREDGYSYEYLNNQYASFKFDSKNQTFSTKAMGAFDSHPDFIENTGKLFIKLKNTEVTGGIDKVVNLKKYSIPIYEDGKNAFVPFSFLSTIAGGSQGYNIAYSGKSIYVFDYGGQLGLETSPSYFGDSYYSELSNIDEPRPRDVIDYTYNELCFTFDNLRGRTQQLYMGDENLLSLGLDGVLTRDYPKIKEYLLSSNKQNFYEGYNALFLALYDGGHTVNIASKSFDAFTNAISRKSEQLFIDLTEGISTRSKASESTRTSFLTTKLTKVGFNGNYYKYDSENSIAYIGFDKFVVDYQGWDDFYNGKGEVPVETDTYAFIRDKVYQAKADSARNLVLDLTTNGGGSSYALEGILGLFNKGKAYIRMQNTFNDYIVKENHLIDINLDGKWNEDDETEASSFDFNVGVLTSNYAFSCGNLLPFNMKELGYKILGEKTGGGSCAVAYQVTEEGLPFVHSSYYCLVDSNGNNIDGGVGVDLSIEKAPLPETSSLYDCSEFYNFASVSEYLNSAYNK